MDLFRSTLQPVEKALNDAKLDKGAIHDVVLVGKCNINLMSIQYKVQCYKNLYFVIKVVQLEFPKSRKCFKTFLVEKHLI